jgi:hypothetical protein
MRKILLATSLAAILAVPAISTAASAQERFHGPGYVAPVVAGAAVGTAVGVGLANGWYSGAFASALPSTTVGAAAAGGVAGVGTVALIDAAVRPCQGFQALFNNFLTHSAGECVDGQWVGYAPSGPRRMR